MQQRLPRYRRSPESKLPRSRITPLSLAIIRYLEQFKLLPSSAIIALVGGNGRAVQRHLQTHYHKGLWNRFSFDKPGVKNTELYYYLDNKAALELLAELPDVDPSTLDWEGVKRHRERP